MRKIIDAISWNRRFSAVLILSSLALAARADVIEDQAGQSTDQALVETYSMEPAPPQFHFRLLKDGRLTAETFPVQGAQVRKIEFRPLWESPLPLKGRLATMITAPGYRYENIWVESVAQEGGELVFQIRQAGVGPGGPAHPVKASGIRSLQFEPSLPPGAMLPPPVTRIIEDATPTPAAPAYYMPPPGVPVEGMIFDRGMGEPVPAPPPAQPQQPAPGALIDPGIGLPPPAGQPPAQP